VLETLKESICDLSSVWSIQTEKGLSTFSLLFFKCRMPTTHSTHTVHTQYTQPSANYRWLWNATHRQQGNEVRQEPRTNRDSRWGWSGWILLLQSSQPSEGERGRGTPSCSGDDDLEPQPGRMDCYRVRTVMGNLEKSWNCKMVISRPGKDIEKNNSSWTIVIFICAFTLSFK